jgi:hypothetical protein
MILKILMEQISGYGKLNIRNTRDRVMPNPFLKINESSFKYDTMFIEVLPMMDTWCDL